MVTGKDVIIEDTNSESKESVDLEPKNEEVESVETLPVVIDADVTESVEQTDENTSEPEEIVETQEIESSPEPEAETASDENTIESEETEDSNSEDSAEDICSNPLVGPIAV